MAEDVKAAVQVFTHHLTQLVDAVGRPAPTRLRTVNKELRDSISVSALDDHLRGRRVRLMRWPLVRALLFACQTIARDDRLILDSNLLGTETEWSNAWHIASIGEVPPSPLRVAELGEYAIAAPRLPGAPAPEPPQAAAKAFAGHLVQLVNAVGNPKPYRLQKVSKNRLSASTVEDHLRGVRIGIAPWPIVRELLLACAAIAREDRLLLKLSDLGIEDEWRRVWNAARHGYVLPSPVRVARPTGDPLTGSGSPGAPALDGLAEPEPSQPAAAPAPGAPPERARGEAAEELAPPLTRATPAAVTGTATPVLPGTRSGSSGPYILYMPDLGEGGGWATVLNWRYSPGDQVIAGDDLVAINNEMVSLDLPAPITGMIEDLYAHAGDSVFSGGPLCAILPGLRKEPASALAPIDESFTDERPAGSSVGRAPYITPLVRDLADAYEVDLGLVRGSGAGGRIRRQDVLDAAKAQGKQVP
ncbi:E3 binding domain-containing protein [Actinoallomurus spadix]|uniref:Peripheral subunit-binding (PSBD) domain-containing protein n=1 Tax=Actinoallomurus spadix TaxID=79912 RepID=A0ABN0WQD1_9ACTN|nr:E3 binding domain-containing protein [Actinoallomurus spadix]MCO5984897.1 E3 binding domain-containing protein [Actinoallomurus spadix]